MGTAAKKPITTAVTLGFTGHFWVLLATIMEKSLTAAPTLGITGSCSALQQRKI